MKTVPAGGIVAIVDSSIEGASLSDLEGSCLVKGQMGHHQRFNVRRGSA
jgi:hypothetical protein